MKESLKLMVEELYVFVFQKQGTLAEFYKTNTYGERGHREEIFANMQRDVQLVLHCGVDDHANLVARIQCPVNPLPVKGDFHCHSFRVVQNFLLKSGWRLVAKYPAK